MSSNTIMQSSAANWLSVQPTEDPMVFRHEFVETHIGNPWIRSLHGGVTAGLSEICAEAAVLAADPTAKRCEVATNSVNYLKSTRDEGVWIKVDIFRTTKRAAFATVTCWQDSEDKPVTQATCTMRVFR